MENQTDPNIHNQPLTGELIRQTLASWYFILLMALPPLIWAIFSTVSSLPRVIIVGFAGIAIYQSWRLWLDSNYFTTITEENNQQAGKILSILWQKEKLQYLTLQQRHQSALKQLKHSLQTIATLWLIWLLSLLVT